MNSQLKDILIKNGWRSNNPVSIDKIRELGEKFNYTLPGDYDLSAIPNGGSSFGVLKPR